MISQKAIMKEFIPEEEKEIEPCQLSPCNLICAFENCCPVYYADSNEVPIFRKLTKEDLEPRAESRPSDGLMT